MNVFPVPRGDLWSVYPREGHLLQAELRRESGACVSVGSVLLTRHRAVETLTFAGLGFVRLKLIS